MSRHGGSCSSGKQHQTDSLCKATLIGQETRARRKSVSAGNIRCGQHLLRSWSTDQTVIAMSSGEAELYAACMAAQQAMGTENMARESGVHLGHGTASGRQCGHWNHWQTGIGTIETSGPDLLVAAVSCAGKQVNLKKVQSESNMADLRTMGAREGQNRSTHEEFWMRTI